MVRQTSRPTDPDCGRFLAGDTEVIRRVRRAAASGVCSTLCSPDDALEDLVSETLLAVYRTLQCNRVYHLRAYAFGAATKLTKNWLARKQTASRHAPILREDEEARLRSQSPAQQLICRELRNAVRKAIDSLPVRMRQIVLLRYAADLRNHEIAHVLGLSPGAIAATLFKARCRLRRLLALWSPPPN